MRTSCRKVSSPGCLDTDTVPSSLALIGDGDAFDQPELQIRNWSKDSSQRARPHRSVSRTITGTGVRPGKPIPLPSNGSVRMSFCAAKPVGLALRSPTGRSWPSNGRCLKRLPQLTRRDDFAIKETSKRTRDTETEADPPTWKSQSSNLTKNIAAKNQTFTWGTPMHTLTQGAMKMLSAIIGHCPLRSYWTSKVISKLLSWHNFTRKKVHNQRFHMYRDHFILCKWNRSVIRQLHVVARR